MGAAGLASSLAPADLVLLGLAALGGAVVYEYNRPGRERLQQPG